MWKVLVKDVDLGEPTSFLDHVYLRCSPQECQRSKDIVDNCRNMFGSKISAGATEKLLYSEKLGAHIFSWSYDIEGHAKKCVERCCEFAYKTIEQLYKVATPCMDDHQFREEEMDQLEKVSIVCSHIVLKCLYLARIGRPDFLWSVNKLARAVTKWTTTCYKRLSRLISYIHHTCEYRQHCHVENTAQQCRLGLFQESDFAGDLEDSKSTSEGLLCIFTDWTTWYSMVSEQTCTIDHKMDQSLWQNDWIDWFHIFIIHVNTNSIVLWVILLNSADWDCFKTLTSREILRIQNPLLEEHCAFLEVTRSCQ